MPKVKAEYKTLNDIPEPLRDFYEETDGTYVLSAEGAVLEKDHSNLRKALESERKIAADLKRSVKPWNDLAAELGDDITPEKVRELREQYRKLQADLEAVTKDEKRAIDLAVSERVQALEQRAAQELAKSKTFAQLEKERADKYETIVREQQFKNKISESFGEFVHPTAVEDLVTRAKKFGWQLDSDGNLIAKTPKGDPIYSLREPRLQMTPEEWSQDIAPKEAPHAYKQSSGTGDMMRSGMPANRKRSEMSVAERVEFVKQFGNEKFQKLPY